MPSDLENLDTTLDGMTMSLFSDDPGFKLMVRPNCGFCASAVRVLAAKGIVYETIEFDDSSKAHWEFRELLSRLFRHETVPVIFLLNVSRRMEFVGGFVELTHRLELESSLRGVFSRRNGVKLLKFSNCPTCRDTMAHLRDLGMSYESVELVGTEPQVELTKLVNDVYKRHTVPVLFQNLGGDEYVVEYVGGHDGMSNLQRMLTLTGR